MTRADALRPVRRWVRLVEAWELRTFGRSVISTLSRTPALVLETTGRRTGRRRQTPLACTVLDGDWYVIGGAGGQTRTPDWVANLRAEPAATVIVDKRAVPVHATELAGEERAARWATLREVWPQIDDYAAVARRVVPVFRLSPR